MITANTLRQPSALPEWIAPLMAVLFAILWGIWLLPNTVFVRHSAMALGAACGLFVCFKNYRLIFSKEAFSVVCILALLLWVTLHLVFIGQDPVAQLAEYFGVWKKVILCLPFALGMGIAMAQSSRLNRCWDFFYVGLCLPTLIYFIKWIITSNAGAWGVQSPYLLLNADHLGSLFGISRALYVFYCMPAFAAAVFTLLNHRHTFAKFDVLYIAMIVLTPTLYFVENDRTGLLVVALLMMLAVVGVVFSMKKSFNLRTLCIGLLLLVGVAVAAVGFAKKFDRWHSIVANTKVALDIDTYDHWKYQGKKGYPTNEFGETAEGSNYERIAWAKAGSRLLLQNPQGYGLLTLSFDRLTKQQWPDSRLSMTHSGWVDFSLGYGIPGVLLLLCASMLAWGSGFRMSDPWGTFVIWGFGSMNLIFLMKELSVETCVNALIFIILFISAFFAATNARLTNVTVTKAKS